MSRRRRPLAAAVAAVALAAAAPHVEAVRVDPQRVQWRELHFSASRFFLTAQTKIALRTLDAAEARKELAAAAGGHGLAPDGPTVTVAIDSRLAGRRSHERIVFDAKDLAAFERHKANEGKDPYQKTFRYREDGVALRRIAPRTAAERDLPPARWTKVEPSDYPHGAARRGCAVVSEPIALLYLVSALDLDRGAAVELCVFTDNELHRVEVAGRGLEQVPASYVVVGPGGRETTHQGPVEARRLAVTPRPAAGGEGGSFELLGLTGDLEVLIERERRLPLVVAGRLDGLGRVEVRLDRAVLR